MKIVLHDTYCAYHSTDPAHLSFGVMRFSAAPSPAHGGNILILQPPNQHPDYSENEGSALR